MAIQDIMAPPGPGEEELPPPAPEAPVEAPPAPPDPNGLIASIQAQLDQLRAALSDLGG